MLFQKIKIKSNVHKSFNPAAVSYLGIEPLTCGLLLGCHTGLV